MWPTDKIKRRQPAPGSWSENGLEYMASRMVLWIKGNSCKNEQKAQQQCHHAQIPDVITYVGRIHRLEIKVADKVGILL